MARTDGVYVVLTSREDTLAAARVAAVVAKAMGASVTLVHTCNVPDSLSSRDAEEPPGADAQACLSCLRSEGIEARARVYMCPRGERLRAIPSAFRNRSLVVIGGRRSWWPTDAERLRRRLEAAGHLVLFVDRSEKEEVTRA